MQHDPVYVVIADVENRTKDPAFDGVLEPMMSRALEGAGFITAYDRVGIRRLFRVEAPEEFGEAAARALAVKQGLGVVLAGTIEPSGRGYRISVKATRSVTGDTITSTAAVATSRDDVLAASTRLMTRVRNDLGDDESQSAQMFAMTTLSATSLDVVRHFATALEAQSNTRFDEARESLLEAIKLDPQFGIGYQSLAGVSRNLGKLEEARMYSEQAVKHIDGMTDRERYNTRGMYARITGDYEQCVKQYGELTSRYSGDVVGRNGLALCLSLLRRLPEAADVVRRVVQLLPNLSLFRTNLSVLRQLRERFPGCRTGSTRRSACRSLLDTWAGVRDARPGTD